MLGLLWTCKMRWKICGQNCLGYTIEKYEVHDIELEEMKTCLNEQDKEIAA